MVGDTVTLYTGIVIKSQDVIEWRFGVEQDLIAKINREAKTEKLFNGTDGRFINRLKMNSQTGDLTITNITTQLTGLYNLDITGQTVTTKPFNVSLCAGVFGDEVKPVSLLEGDSVTLHTEITDIKKYDVIRWRFLHENSPLAEFNRKAGNPPKYVSDGRFRDKLQLDVQTGSLNIKNIRRNHSGLYEVDISSSSYTIHQPFTVTVSGEVKSVSVMEGESVTLYTDTKLQRDDEIEWRFGPQEALIAKINKAANVNSIFHDVFDWRFRDRLRLNNQTGDLNITNITTEKFGLYELKMNSRKRSIYRKFIVNVSEREKKERSSGLSIGAIIGFCVLAFLSVAGIVGVIIWCHHRFPKAKTPVVIEGEEVILHTDLTRLHKNLEIKWKFGDQKTLIAEMRRSNITIYDDVLNGIFRGRLALRESGSLVISETRTTDAGLYQLKITSGRKTYKRFRLTVTGQNSVEMSLLNGNLQQQ
nr:uncharacterized protein LOC129452884 isoform X2 [Misgurnus anguillicaudatus]